MDFKRFVQNKVRNGARPPTSEILFLSFNGSVNLGQIN